MFSANDGDRFPFSTHTQSDKRNTAKDQMIYFKPLTKEVLYQYDMTKTTICRHDTFRICWILVWTKPPDVEHIHLQQRSEQHRNQADINWTGAQRPWLIHILTKHKHLMMKVSLEVETWKRDDHRLRGLVKKVSLLPRQRLNKSSILHHKSLKCLQNIKILKRLSIFLFCQQSGCQI